MKTVFTNGVFDILHIGHIKLLKYARSLGDMLVVAINSDESVRRIKGPNRPIMDQDERLNILRELRCVDRVVFFFENTPENVIMEIRPDILVKGPEALNAPIPGAEYVLSYGGQVIVPDWPVNQSTSKIIQYIRNL